MSIVAPGIEVFILAAVLGAALGILYDAFRIVRFGFCRGAAAAFVFDVVFFSLAGGAAFLFLLTYCFGYVRWFVIAAGVIGFLVYYLTLGRLVYASAKAVIGFLRFLLRPFKKIFIFLKKGLTNVYVLLYNRINAVISRAGGEKPKRHEKTTRKKKPDKKTD